MTVCHRIIDGGIAMSTGSGTDLFSRKKKMRAFLAGNIFAGPGDPDFFVKNGSAGKFTTMQKMSISCTPGIRVITR